MTTHTAVCIDDDLAASQTGVGVRTTFDEFTSWVDINGIVIFCKLRRNHRANNLFNQVWTNDCVAIDAVGMLSRNQNCAQTNWHTVFVVESDLGLAIWAQVWNCARLSHFAELFCHAVSQPNWQRHQIFSFGTCVAKHHSLVASTLTV